MSVRRLAAAEVQPAAFAFNNDNAAWAEATISKFPEGRQQSAVIPLLMRAQEQEGWITKAALERIAQMLGMAYIRVLEVATFYTQFQLKPVGSRAHIQICGTTPCMLRGAGELVDVCRARIHHEQFNLNASGTLSWEEVECLGACVNAPMIMVFKDTYEDLTPERLAEIIDDLEAGRDVPVGPQNGRTVSIPASGQTTLLDEQVFIDQVRRRRELPAEPAVTAESGDVPPSRAAKPSTDAPETNSATQSPSPVKVDPASETPKDSVAPSFDQKAADMAEPRVEGEGKERERPTAQEGNLGVKAPELHKGAAVSANEKRSTEDKSVPDAAPSPNGKNDGNTGEHVGAPKAASTNKSGEA